MSEDGGTKTEMVMADVPPDAMRKFKRLQAMRDMAQAALQGANANALEAQPAWNQNWNQVCAQLSTYGTPELSEEGELWCEQPRLSGAKRVDPPGAKHLAAQLVRSREDLREARRLVTEAGKRAAPLLRLAMECERLLAERYQWAANPFTVNTATTYGAVS